ncbi:MAG: hypothetical protein MUF15_24430, partial [Acidobacteria bacterium]|nr:hypothetical protein [Acidobacteriota bacterium]
MSKKEDYKNELLNYLDEYLNSGNSDNIGSLLTSKSNLPGPRANLELRDVFAEVCGEKFNSDKQKVWKICLDFCGISAEEAPANNPHEFLPFCGAAALGNLGSHSEEYRSQAFKHLKSLANDSRWRIREAVSHSLTTILVKFPEITLDELESWLKKDNWLEMRAVAAAVGSPSFLAANSDAAKKALAFHRTIAQNM